MAPISILLTDTSDAQAASLIPTPKTDDAATAEYPSESTVLDHNDQQQCQICFDDCALDERAISAFCSASCPAVLCRGCVAEYVRVSVGAAFPGVLPKVRCPICLVAVNKSKWAHLVSQEVVAKYVQLCRDACSFRAPCCHDSSYTHLPREVDATDLPRKYIKPAELTLAPELTTQIESLHHETQRFCDFEISSKELIIFIEDTFGRHVDAETQHLILEHELPTIMDEERRATLLLSYHAKYKVVTTRCCGRKTCFNCKRDMTSHPKGDANACDHGSIKADCIIECRSCHVTMVKVAGCSGVRCWCGFVMNWTVELRIRDHHNKQLIPVDIYDIKIYKAWETWQQTISRLVTKDVARTWLAMRKRRIGQQLTDIPGLCRTLRKLLHRQYIWRGRLKRALPEMQEEMVRVRMLVLAKRLQRHEAFVVAVGRCLWRRRFAQSLHQLETELGECRMARCVARVAKVACFVEAQRRAKWRTCWRRVVKSVHAKRFWLCYRSEHGGEQRALRAEETAMLLPGF